MTLKRVITAFFLVPSVAFIVLYTTAFWLFVAASIITLLALSEFNQLNALKLRERRAGVTGVVLGAALPSLVFYLGLDVVPPFVVAAIFVFFFMNMVAGGEKGPVEIEAGTDKPVVAQLIFRDCLADVSIKTLSLVYIALPLSYLPLIKGLQDGGWWIMLLFFIVWGNDTFAYFTGRAWGRKKLSPRISPKKTVVGLVGGFAGGAFAALVCNALFGLGMTVPAALLLSIIVGAVAVPGDLIESVIKRAAGVKDSGSIIPGHGGILDRLDSLLFPIPVVYYFLLWQLST